jgi:hypothetical protein
VYTLPRPLILRKNRNLEAALIYFATDNYLVNIDESNQRFIYSPDNGVTRKKINLPVGAYQLSGINAEIKRQMTSNGDNSDFINIEANKNTFSSIINITDKKYEVAFTHEKTLRDLLGFNVGVLLKGKHESLKTVQITSAKAINIHCSLVPQSYDSRGIESDIIYSFPAYKVGIGYKIRGSKYTKIFTCSSRSDKRNQI